MTDPGLSPAALLVAGFDGLEPSGEIRELIAAGLAGVILYGKNCRDAAQVRELTATLQEEARRAGSDLPLLVAVDQEQGRVVRLREGLTLFPAMGVVARTGDPGLVGRVARAVSSELLAVGVNWNLAPVADVLSAPDCPVGDRSFGSDPAAVAAMVSAYLAGAREAGMLTCVKHFPGHGATGADSHTAAPVVGAGREELERRDLVPFRAAVAAGAPAVMTTHITFPALDPAAPATLSAPILKELLRGEIGFEGVVVSDDLEMAGVAQGRSLERSARDALRAGADLLIVSGMLLPESDLAGLLRDLKRDPAWSSPVEDARQAAVRVRRLRRAAALGPVSPGEMARICRSPEHRTLLDEVNRAVASS